MTYEIIHLGNGWYDFKNIPQGYIKIHGLNVGSHTKAINRAEKMLKAQCLLDNADICVVEDNRHD